MTWTRARIGALAVVVMLLALIARSPGLDLFPTQDEDNWLDRSSAFSSALAASRLARDLP